MKAESQPLPGTLDLLAELAADGYLMVTLNNESLELNEHRLTAFSSATTSLGSSARDI